MKVCLATLALTLAASTPVFAETPANYIALALADGPTPQQRLVISAHSSDANEAVRSALKSCYLRAASGYMHTCQVWYGDAWIVGTMCLQSPTAVKLAIGDDANSPEAARDKAVKFLRDSEHADVSNCQVVGEYNANNVQVARSAARDKTLMQGAAEQTL